MKQQRRWAIAWLAYAIQLLGIVVFARGFFPYKAQVEGFASLSDYGPDLEHAPARFERVVFIVIDALRRHVGQCGDMLTTSDFMFGADSQFHRVQSIIANGHGIGFTALAMPPTVTLPRIKALTTGSIPNFLDAILNVAEGDASSTLRGQDSWLYQLSKSSRTINFFGDDTWLKLFPGMFSTYEGTSSFFVNDFVQVDNNVTRHLPQQLVEPEWSGLVLHYLGLDHIGHTGGPGSPYMPSKQQEMDGIIDTVYHGLAATTNATLIVVCGDHGMTASGNHGGSTAAETHTACAFLSPHATWPTRDTVEHDGEFRFHRTIEQADVVSIVCSLLGLALPRNSLGIVAPEALAPLGRVQSSKAIQRNAAQLARALAHALLRHTPTLAVCEGGDADEPSPARTAYCDYLRAQQLPVDDARLIEFCRDAQHLLSSVSSRYSMTDMCFGVVVVATAFAVLYTFFSCRGQPSGGFMVTMVAAAASMFASSYVEEEHQYWYFVETSVLVWQLARQSGQRPRECKHGAANGAKLPSSKYKVTCGVAALAAARLLRRWRQSGQKFAGAPAIASHTLPQYPGLMWALALLAIVVPVVRYGGRRRRRCRPVSYLLHCLCALCVTAHAISFSHRAGAQLPAVLGPLLRFITMIPLVELARLVFACAAASVAVEALCATRVEPYPFRSHVIQTLQLLLLVQTRVENYAIFLCLRFVIYASLQLAKSGDADGGVVVMDEWYVGVVALSHAAYFSFGAANTLSSVDLAMSYNGISDFNTTIVGVEMFVSNWAGPLYCFLVAYDTYLSYRWERHSAGARLPRISMGKLVHYYALMDMGILLALVVACTALRYHLFVWTVFSPKFLFQAAWCVLYVGVILLTSSI